MLAKISTTLLVLGESDHVVEILRITTDYHGCQHLPTVLVLVLDIYIYKVYNTSQGDIYTLHG